MEKLKIDNLTRGRQTRVERNPEKVREHGRRYYLANREKILAQVKREYKENPEFREKILARRKREYNENPEFHKARNTAWRKRNPEKVNASRRKRMFGITAEQFKVQLGQQGGLCAICRNRPATEMDHDHSTGILRGILCRPCNLGLGGLQDSPQVLSNALFYLKRYGKA